MAVTGAWLEALLQTKQYDKLVDEIVRMASSSDRADELLDWVSKAFRAAGPNADPSGTDAIDKASSALRVAFGEQWSRLHERNLPAIGKVDQVAADLGVSSTSALPHKTVEVPPSWRRKAPTQNLAGDQRQSLILKAIADRGITPDHIAYDSLVSALTQLGDLDLPAGGSYTAIVRLPRPFLLLLHHFAD